MDFKARKGSEGNHVGKFLDGIVVVITIQLLSLGLLGVLGDLSAPKFSYTC